MKLNWVLYSVTSVILLFPLLTIAESEVTGNITSTETTKPDNDQQNPLDGADITIIKNQQRTIAEYRLNGRLIQVKITPKHGYSYYLIDTDGNGTLDVRSSESWKNTTVNTWKIFQW
jgi:hypothetical protein